MGIIFKGQEIVRTRENDLFSWLAWHVAALSRTPKRMPSLDSIRIKEKKTQPQTWQQQLAIAQMWASQRGGKINRKVN